MQREREWKKEKERLSKKRHRKKEIEEEINKKTKET
jgi:hypothetical protein